MEKNKKIEKPISKEDFEDKVFVNYNVLSKLNLFSTQLEEIKRIDFAILEILNAFYQKVISEEVKENPQKKGEEREGTLKST